MPRPNLARSSSRLVAILVGVAFGPTTKRITVLFPYDVNRALEIATTERAKTKHLGV